MQSIKEHHFNWIRKAQKGSEQRLIDVKNCIFPVYTMFHTINVPIHTHADKQKGGNSTKQGETLSLHT